MPRNFLILLPLLSLLMGAGLILVLPSLDGDETMIRIEESTLWYAEPIGMDPQDEGKDLGPAPRAGERNRTPRRRGEPSGSKPWTGEDGDDGKADAEAPGEPGPVSPPASPDRAPSAQPCRTETPAKPPSIIRIDPLPERLDGFWPIDPEGDEPGSPNPSLEKVDNPVIELREFWVDEDRRQSPESTLTGVFKVKTDGKVDVEEGTTTALEGRVIDSQTGTGIPGATVVLFSTFYKRQVYYDHHLEEVAGGVTDGDGTFRIEGFNMEAFHFGSAGKAFLTVIASGWVSRVAWYLQAILPGRENDIGDVPLARGGSTLVGRVVDRQLKPVPGALVACTGEIFPTEYSKDQRYKFLPRFPNARCEGDGTFEIKGIAGKHWVTVHVGPDSVASQLREFKDSGPDPFMQFVVVAGGFVEGSVVDTGENPVAGAVIYGGGNSTHTYVDGSFRLENIEGTLIDLQVRHHLFKTMNFEKARVGETGLKIVLTVRLPRIVFRVRQAESLEPLRDVRVRFGPSNALVGGVPDSPLFRNDEGLFSVVVPEGAVFAVIEAQNHGTQTAPLGEVMDGDEIEVVLSPVK
ncbi:MAG: hypothetical protein ACYTFG_05500 [Planctomycetota bacterium]|jgi:hypothetical protein